MRPRPDIVVSGINAGPTSAMTSSTPAPSPPQWKAVIWAFRRWPSPEWHQHYDTAAASPALSCAALSREPLRTGRILNINVPDLPLEQIKGIRVTRCGSRHPADQVIPQKIRAAIRCTGLARRARSTMPGRIPILPPWMKAMFP
jgi:5'-nucleotidase